MITIITGHYGSGKSTLAVNLAVKAAENGERVAVCDLDIVNPFFRSADSADLFEEKGIEMIVPYGANTNLETVYLPPEVDRIFTQDMHSFLDIGGDDDGAIVLGRYAQRLENVGYEMICVISRYRPFTATPEEAAEMVRAIEETSKLKVTALVNNSSLGCNTDAATIVESAEYAKKTSELTGIPLIYTTVEESVYRTLGDKERSLLGNILPIKIYTKRLF